MRDCLQTFQGLGHSVVEKSSCGRNSRDFAIVDMIVRMCFFFSSSSCVGVSCVFVPSILVTVPPTKSRRGLHFAVYVEDYTCSVYFSVQLHTSYNRPGSHTGGAFFFFLRLNMRIHDFEKSCVIERPKHPHTHSTLDRSAARQWIRKGPSSLMCGQHAAFFFYSRGDRV